MAGYIYPRDLGVEIVALVLFLSFLLWLALRLASKRRVMQKENPWAALLIRAMEKPLRYWILLSLAVYAAHEWGYRFPYSDTIGFFGILAFIWFLFRLRRYGQRRLKETASLSTHYISMLGYFFSLAILFVAALLLLKNFGFSATQLMVLGGGGGLVLGAASKGVFSKFLSGIMLNITNPFRENEGIYLPALNVEGNVEKIGLGRTRLRHNDKSSIFLSNKYFADSVIVNNSRRTHRPLDLTLSLPMRHLGAIPSITGEIRALLVQSVLVDPEEEVLVAFSEFGAGMAQIMIYALLVAVQEEAYRWSVHEILSKIGKVIDSHGVSLALPLMKIRGASWSGS